MHYFQNPLKFVPVNNSSPHQCCIKKMCLGQGGGQTMNLQNVGGGGGEGVYDVLTI